MFPIWFLFFFPVLWLVMLPVNFGVDSLVLMLSARKQGVEDRKALWKKHILPIWPALVSDNTPRLHQGRGKDRACGWPVCALP